MVNEWIWNVSVTKKENYNIHCKNAATYIIHCISLHLILAELKEKKNLVLLSPCSAIPPKMFKSIEQ